MEDFNNDKYEYLPISQTKKGDIVQFVGLNGKQYTKNDAWTVSKLYIASTDYSKNGYDNPPWGHIDKGHIGTTFDDKGSSTNGWGAGLFALVKTRPGTEAKVGDEIIRIETKNGINEGEVDVVTLIEGTCFSTKNHPTRAVNADRYKVLCKKETISSVKVGDRGTLNQLFGIDGMTEKVTKIIPVGTKIKILKGFGQHAASSTIGKIFILTDTGNWKTDTTEMSWIHTKDIEVEILSLGEKPTEPKGTTIEEISPNGSPYNLTIGTKVRILSDTNKGQIATWNGQFWDSTEQKDFWIHTVNDLVELIEDTNITKIVPDLNIPTELSLNDPTSYTLTTINEPIKQTGETQMKNVEIELKVNGQDVVTSKPIKRKTELATDRKQNKIYAVFYSSEEKEVGSAYFKSEKAATQQLATKEYIGCKVMIYKQSSVQQQKLQLENC